MHTNTSVQAMFDKYGDRICGISLNNGKYVSIGYRGENTLQLSDISFETVSGVDMMVLHRTDASRQTPVSYDAYITTEFIEAINVMSEKDKDYRIDLKLVQ